tara:strand:- start:74 stop:694 length:621 start_codon:yes stop_codon:yes gene_type:complete
MDRDSRRLYNNKSDKVDIRQTVPLANEGSDGDLAYVGSIIYIKSNNQWKAINDFAKSSDGYHGSRNIIQIKQSDFFRGDSTINQIVGGIALYLTGSDTDNYLVVEKTIPVGYRVEAIKILSNGARSGAGDTMDFSVYRRSCLQSASLETLANYHDVEDGELAINSSTFSSDEYIQIFLRYVHGIGDSDTDMIYGGYIKIKQVKDKI